MGGSQSKDEESGRVSCRLVPSPEADVENTSRASAISDDDDDDDDDDDGTIEDFEGILSHPRLGDSGVAITLTISSGRLAEWTPVMPVGQIKKNGQTLPLAVLIEEHGSKHGSLLTVTWVDKQTRCSGRRTGNTIEGEVWQEGHGGGTFSLQKVCANNFHFTDNHGDKIELKVTAGELRVIVNDFDLGYWMGFDPKTRKYTNTNFQFTRLGFGIVPSADVLGLEGFLENVEANAFRFTDKDGDSITLKVMMGAFHVFVNGESVGRRLSLEDGTALCSRANAKFAGGLGKGTVPHAAKGATLEPSVAGTSRGLVSNRHLSMSSTSSTTTS